MPEPAQVLNLYDRGRWQHHWSIAWLYEREERVLLESLDAKPGHVVLDAGCGNGLHSRTLASQGIEVHAIDLAPSLVDGVRPFVARAETASIEDVDMGQKYDRIVCFGVLDFVGDPDRAFANLVKHLKPGGRMALLVPRKNAGGFLYYIKHRVKNGMRVNLFSEAELAEKARAHELTPVAVVRPWPHNVVFVWTKGS